MRALEDAGFHPITVEDAARYIRTGDTRALPAKPVLITFDDGRTEAMLQADPILRDTDMRAAVFAIGKEASSSSLFSSVGAVSAATRPAGAGSSRTTPTPEPLDRRREGLPARLAARRVAGRDAAPVRQARRRRSRPRPGDPSRPRAAGGRLLVPVRRLGPARPTPVSVAALRRCSASGSSSRSTRTGRPAGASRSPATTGCTSTGSRCRTGRARS